jgi:uncharacterized membrane protein SirB2
MDLLTLLIHYILARAGVSSERAARALDAVTHALIVYMLLTAAGLAIFVPAHPALPKIVAWILPALVVALLSITLWTDYYTERDRAEQLLSIFVSAAATYLACVGIGILVRSEVEDTLADASRLTNMFVLVIAFLIYTRRDLHRTNGATG